MILQRRFIMQTVQIQINDDLYEHLSAHNIDIQAKIKDYLLALVGTNNYPSISTEEAKKRVSDAIDRYESGSGQHVSLDSNYAKELSTFIERL